MRRHTSCNEADASYLSLRCVYRDGRTVPHDHRMVGSREFNCFSVFTGTETTLVGRQTWPNAGAGHIARRGAHYRLHFHHCLLVCGNTTWELLVPSGGRIPRRSSRGAVYGYSCKPCVHLGHIDRWNQVSVNDTL